MGPRNQFDISDRVEIGGVEITRVNCISVYIEPSPKEREKEEREDR